MQSRLSLIRKQPHSGRYFLISLFLMLILILVISNITGNVLADDDEDEEDDDNDEGLASDLGWASVGLLGVSSIYIFLYQGFKITRKFSDEGSFAETKENYRKFFLTVRKPFLYIHYASGFAALVLLLIHGALLTKQDIEPVAVGWTSGAIYIFYILTGIILWWKIKPFWSSKKARKALLWLHRSLLIFTIGIIIHIVHVAISD